MSARTIVTSQPDVACDVCARRLLRGEQPDVFLADGRRLLVCELCVPRARHAGWLRASESQEPALPSARPRRGRSMFARLRQATRGPGDERATEAPAAERGREQLTPAQDAAEPQAEHDLGEGGRWQEVPGQALARDASVRHTGGGGPRSYVQEAVEVFNASPFPRRVAGLVRSLGAPLVSVRSAEHLASVVQIVISWELCWYRYEIDLSEGATEVQVLEQGRELNELPREERRANAHTRASGELELDPVGASEAPVADRV